MTDQKPQRTSFTSFLVGVGVLTAILMTTATGYQFFAKKRITCFYAQDANTGSVTITKRFKPTCEKVLGPNWHSRPSL